MNLPQSVCRRSPTPAKPKKGTPCNGCGCCCHTEVCRVGRHFFPDAPAPWPAIIFHDGKVRCGFVLAEIGLMANQSGTKPMQAALGIGQRCCSNDPEDA